MTMFSVAIRGRRGNEMKELPLLFIFREPIDATPAFSMLCHTFGVRCYQQKSRK